MSHPTLVLASSSPYRAELLSRLNISFEQASPDVDESPLENETAEELVLRLALLKAKALETKYPNALIIGSDQVALLDNKILGKPGNHQNAVQQLKNASGRTVTFLTSLCLYNSQSKQHQLDVAPYQVSFRDLTDQQIENYLKTEQPYNCAGSFKSEGLGITLFASQKGEDPNALIGLPLIRLVTMLNNEGIEVI